jgi:hypothetical protein
MDITKFGSVAQSVEQRTENPCVGGSIPSRATIFYRVLTMAVVAKWLTHLIVVQAFVGSIPISRPIEKYLRV